MLHSSGRDWNVATVSVLNRLAIGDEIDITAGTAIYRHRVNGPAVTKPNVRAVTLVATIISATATRTA